MELQTGENPFDLQDEVFFICYDEIIRSPYPFLLDKLINDKPIRDAYAQFINVKPIEHFDIDNLLTYAFQRKYPNILDELAIRTFDSNGALKELKDRYLEVYLTAPLLTIGVAMRAFLREKTVKTIYFYTPEYDKRVEFDIYKEFDSHKKIQYVYGDIHEAYDLLIDKPTAYFINNIDMIHDMATNPDILDYAHLFLADYRYNYTVDDDGELDFRFNIGEVVGDEVNCKFATFSPVTLEEKNITQFAELYGITTNDINDSNNL